MRLCVTSTGKETGAKIDMRFGRAPYFLIIDMDTNDIEAVQNSAASDGQGAGIGAAQLVSGKNVDVVITGRVGPNALTVLRASRIKLYEGASPDDTVKEVLDRFQRGEYIETPVASDISPRGQGGGRGLGRGMAGKGQGRGMGGGRGRF